MPFRPLTVIQAACGERAGEVLETIEEFAVMQDRGVAC